MGTQTINDNRINRILGATRIVIALLAVSLALVSCGGDDDDSPGTSQTGNVRQELRNSKWIAQDAWFDETVSGHAWLDVENTTLYFTSAAGGLMYNYMRSYDTDLGNSSSRSWELFDYTVLGADVDIHFENGMSTSLKWVDGYLVDASGTSLFRKATMSSGDYEIIQKCRPLTGPCGGNLTYTFDSRTGELDISGSGQMVNYAQGGAPWATWNVKTVFVGNGCTRIGDHAFDKMTSITEIDLANSVAEIGVRAFAGLFLRNFDLPSGLKRIEKSAFGDCVYMKTVSFYHCSELEFIGEQAFAGCPINDYLTLPASVREVGPYAFMSANLKSLTLNDKLQKVGDWAFGYINNKKLVIPNSVTEVGAVAFTGAMNEIVIGTGLDDIGRMAFNGAASGKISVNQTTPPYFVDGAIVCNPSGGDAAQSWTLYVPQGCKASYQSKAVWKNFKKIVEDASLTGW